MNTKLLYIRCMAQFVHPNLADVPIESVLHALSEPARLKIVARLAEACGSGADSDGLSCSDGACADMPRATMSNHYGVLRAAGLVRSRKEGVRVLNSLRRKELDQRFPGLLDAVLAKKH